MTTHSTVSLIAIGLACITLMVVTATLKGYDTGLVTGAVGVITSTIAAMVGIVGGGKVKETKIKKFLEDAEMQKFEDRREELQRPPN